MSPILPRGRALLVLLLVLLPLARATDPILALDDPGRDEATWLVTAAGSTHMPDCRAPAADLRSFTVARDGDDLVLRIVREAPGAAILCNHVLLDRPDAESGSVTFWNASGPASGPKGLVTLHVLVRETPAGTEVCRIFTFDFVERPRCAPVPRESVRDGGAWVLREPLAGVVIGADGTPHAYDLGEGEWLTHASVNVVYAFGPTPTEVAALRAYDSIERTTLSF